MPFDQTDLLKQAGFADGDRLTLASEGHVSSFGTSFSSSSFTKEFGLINYRVTPSMLVPDGTIQVRFVSAVDAGTGETVTAGIIDARDNTSIPGTRVSTDTVEIIDSGWTEYTPTDPDSPSQLIIEAKTEPATNSSTVRASTIHLGVKL